MSVFILTSAFLITSLAAGRPAHAAPAAGAARAAEAQESVVVTGQGEVFGQPDTLEADFAVETTAVTVAGALARASKASTRMRDVLVRGGVKKDDLQTSRMSITSTRKDNGPITGYTVQQGLTAKIRDLPRAGALMSATVAAGGNAARINGVSFAIEDDSALLEQARKRAFADARGKAELYAREVGRPLGRVVKVTESGGGGWAPGGQDRYAAADASIPVEPGRQRLSVSVTVEWAFAQGQQRR
ncbi:MAG: SIMPL domain-containing protein [Actinomycetota bacterium]|nr:SIMPL domain-containing protein [Actinomycetota bacterium]